jgi:hypothetical protein
VRDCATVHKEGVGEGATGLGAIEMVAPGGISGLFAENTGLGPTEPISDIV